MSHRRLAALIAVLLVAGCYAESDEGAAGDPLDGAAGSGEAGTGTPRSAASTSAAGTSAGPPAHAAVPNPLGGGCGAGGALASNGAAGRAETSASGQGGTAGAPPKGGSGGGDAVAGAPSTGGGSGAGGQAGAPVACPPPEWPSESISLTGEPCAPEGEYCSKRVGECFCPTLITYPVFQPYSCKGGRWLASGPGPSCNCPGGNGGAGNGPAGGTGGAPATGGTGGAGGRDPSGAGGSDAGTDGANDAPPMP